MFEKKEWKKGDSFPGATDLNRLEDGIADNSEVIERIKNLPKLDKSAKNADIIAAFNGLIDAINGTTEKEEGE